MKIDANDPRWTAFALGEIKDAEERAELERILLESEEIRRLVDEIRRTAELLNDSLRNESPAVLTEVQRSRIEFRVTKGGVWYFSRPLWALSGVAALLLLTVSVWMYQSKVNETDSSGRGTLMADLRTEEKVPGPDASNVELLKTENEKRAPVAQTAPEALSTAENAAANAAVSNSGAHASGSDKPVSKERVPNVELAPTSVIVEGKPVESEDAARKGEPVKAPVPAAGKEPEFELFLPAAKIPDALALVQAGKSTGKEASISGNRIWEADQKTLAGIGPDQVDVQRDGVTVNDVRYASDLNSPVHLNPEQVGKMKLVTAPVDAEMARRRYPAPPPLPGPPRPRERRMPPVPGDKFNTESYDNIVDNPFMETAQNPLSTFSIDVDTASYSNIRRFLEGDKLPPKDAVRIEELVNYFDYDYKGPDGKDPFAASFEMTEAPWDSEHRLLRIGLKALDVDPKERPATNLVFLIDVSGSMADRNKLPLVKDSLHMLVDRLTETDHVAIVTYAGSTRVALSSTRGDEKWKIHRAIDYLRSGGSTAGASGIKLAYETALKNLIDGGANRVVLATDGDFNVGITSHGELTRLIEEKAESGVFLSALGYGMGNYKDDTLELLADKGRGNYAYIDTIEEAKKVLVEQINATLVSVAKDVKIQVEFNPGRVGAYRLIGYEDRVMPKEDFNDDTKKAGVIGAGHAVTALYEIVPTGKPIPASGVDPLKYQKTVEATDDDFSDEVATVKIRYKEPGGADSRVAAKRAELNELSKRYTPDHPEVVRVTEELEDLQKQFKDSGGEESRLLVFPVKESDGKFGKASKDFKFAASVAAFGMVLRDSPYKGSANLEDALDWAKDGKGPDRYGYREEFIRLIHRAISIKN